MSVVVANPDNGIVEQGAGIAAISSPPGSDLSATQAPRIIATSSILIALSTIAVILRFVARSLSRAGLWWDDWTILLALILSWGACLSMIISATTFGFGKHASSIPSFEDRIRAAEAWFEIFYVYETMYTLSVALTKLSILLFYSRIFTERKFKIALRVVFAAVIIWLLAIEITVLAECVPISGLWDLSQSSRCIELVPFFIGSGVPNIILNVVIVCLPLPMVWTLEIERKHRWALSAVFGLGTFVVGVSIARVIVLSQLSQADITWTYVDPGIWTSVEPSIAVVSACLPILRSLWVWRRRRSENRSNNTLKSRPRSPMHSLKPYPGGKNDKRRTGSFTSRYPINELPGDTEHTWGTQTVIYSPYSQHSRKTSDQDDGGISLSSLPIQKQDRNSVDKRAKTPQDLDGTRIPELYG